MRVLVTGGAGYVGSVLTPMLLAAGHEVTVLDTLRYGGQGLLHCLTQPGMRLIVGDIRDRASVEEAVRDCELVVHLAAIVGYPTCLKHPELARETNVGGTQILVDALGPEQSIVYSSTGSNYGQIDGICSEESPLNPISLYAQTKAAAEDIVMSSGRATALRFATAFGVSPRMRFDLLVNDFVRRALLEKQLIVYEGHFRRTFIHVRDIARSILFAIDNRAVMIGNIYNVGNESLNATKADIAEMIRARIPFYLHYSDSGRDPDVRDYHVSYAKIRNLGFEITRTLEDGITETMQAVRAAATPSITDNTDV
jgi:nucleoside-diphosphate-sugar epimerase